MTSHPDILIRRVRVVMVLFVAGLVLSGLTAFPLQWEMDSLTAWMKLGPEVGPGELPAAGLSWWLVTVREGLRDVNARYPWMAYGTDWLAFAHLILGILFLGALRDPVRNVWVIEFGLLACLAVAPLALVCGPIRGIPFYWRLIDCSFGALALIPLGLAWRMTRRAEALRAACGRPARPPRAQ